LLQREREGERRKERELERERGEKEEQAVTHLLRHFATAYVEVTERQTRDRQVDGRTDRQL
jgi:hypothetical protein